MVGKVVVFVLDFEIFFGTHLSISSDHPLCYIIYNSNGISFDFFFFQLSLDLPFSTIVRRKMAPLGSINFTRDKDNDSVEI